MLNLLNVATAERHVRIEAEAVVEVVMVTMKWGQRMARNVPFETRESLNKEDLIQFCRLKEAEEDIHCPIESTFQRWVKKENAQGQEVSQRNDKNAQGKEILLAPFHPEADRLADKEKLLFIDKRMDAPELGYRPNMHHSQGLKNTPGKEIERDEKVLEARAKEMYKRVFFDTSLEQEDLDRYYEMALSLKAYSIHNKKREYSCFLVGTDRADGVPGRYVFVSVYGYGKDCVPTDTLVVQLEYGFYFEDDNGGFFAPETSEKTCYISDIYKVIGSTGRLAGKDDYVHKLIQNFLFNESISLNLYHSTEYRDKCKTNSFNEWVKENSHLFK